MCNNENIGKNIKLMLFSVYEHIFQGCMGNIQYAKRKHIAFKTKSTVDG